MNTFNADFSSSPASDYLPRNTPQRRGLFFQPPEPSTTPAVPPPSQVFGSSDAGVEVSKLRFGRGSSAIPSSAPRQAYSLRESQNETPGQSKSRSFQYSKNMNNSGMDTDYTEDNMEEDWVDDEEHERVRSEFIEGNMDKAPSAQSLMRFSTNSMRYSSVRPNKGPHPSASRLPRKGQAGLLPGLARDLTKHTQYATLKESDKIILSTEKVLRQLDEACQNASNDIEQQVMISGAAREIVLTWQQGRVGQLPEQGQIGPLPSEAPFEKAQFIATLLFSIYHPCGVDTHLKQSMTNNQMIAEDLDVQPMPQVLLEWMKLHHSNFNSLLPSIISDNDNAVQSDFFWDAVHTLALRGQFSDLMRLLAEADFSYAVEQVPGRPDVPKYTGIQQQAIQSAIYSTRQLLNACPAVQRDDWNVSGQEWDLYRSEVEQALDHLGDLAGGYNDHGLSQASRDLLGRSGTRRGLPHDVYQYLRTLYSILLGDADIILALSQDWLEASLLLVVWWNGEAETKVSQWSFDVSRANNSEPAASPNPYLTRIRDSFLCVTDPDADSNFGLNTLSLVEVGIGAVLQGDVTSILEILQTLSLPVASTVAELGTWAGWLSGSTSTAGLNSEDLMVLNYGSGTESIKKDDVLVRYADALFEREQLQGQGTESVAGWELSFAVVSRLNDVERMQQCIAGFIETLAVTTRSRAERLVQVCTQLGLREQGSKVSERFADHLVNTTNDYGTALLCYARAHAEDKIQQVIDLLSSYSLVQSQAYPAEHEMDETLRILVSNPKAALTDITEADPGAANVLQFYLVGYACLRRFYLLRDHGHSDQQGRYGAVQPVARRKAAAKALIAAVNSAADSIYGGLYDRDRRSAIQVDGLLTLLGEATALVAQDGEQRILTSDQMYALLAAIEDLQTVNDRVFSATEGCMEAALRNYYGSPPPSPHTMLKKSVSSGTNSNFSFSMMGSEMLGRSQESLAAKSMGSAILVGGPDKIARGWDWRAKFTGSDTTAEDILRTLRIGIAKELSIANLEAATGT